MTPAMGCLARAGYSAPVRLSCERNRYLLSRKRDSLLRVCAGKPFSINVLGARAALARSLQKACGPDGPAR